MVDYLYGQTLLSQFHLSDCAYIFYIFQNPKNNILKNFFESLHTFDDIPMKDADRNQLFAHTVL